MSDWRPIETAPERDEFLAYGFYIYPGDKAKTEYIRIACRSNNEKYPWEDDEGEHPKDYFTLWMPLPWPRK